MLRTLLASLFCILVATVSSSADEPKADGTANLFDQLDQNSDGILNPDEIGEDQRKSFQRLVRIGDKDDNGVLTREEYTAAFARPELKGTLLDEGGPARGTGRKPQPFDIDRIFKFADLNGDGKITLEEAPEKAQRRLRPLFERLGKDELTREDLEKVRDRMSAARTTKPAKSLPGAKDMSDLPSSADRDEMRSHTPAIMRVLDTDGDGRLNRQELAALTEKFDRLDQNKDGHLDASELTGTKRLATDRLVTKRPKEAPAGKPNPDRLFKNFDRNEDGFVSKDEAPERLQKRFDRIDADGDGQLSLAEVKQMFDRRGDAGAKKPK